MSQTATLADSASGRNAFYVPCKVQSQSVAYCACLNRQKTIAEDGAVFADWNECRSAARNSSCRALHMRHEENIAGHALYFVPREEIRMADATFTFQPSPGFRKGELVIVAAKPRPKSLEESLAVASAISSYASAVSKAAAALKTAPKPVIEGAKAAPAPAASAPAARPNVIPKPAPGESPIDFLKRLRAATAAVPAA